MTRYCDRHESSDAKNLYKVLLAGLVSLIILVALIILIIYLVLRPTKPCFSLQDATVYQFNVTSSNTLSTVLQVTLLSRNPNSRVGIYYDRLEVYASYRNQEITLPTVLPPTYQGHNDISAWSPFIYGASVPVSPYLTVVLQQDEQGGFVIVAVKVDGLLKWKVGTWVSGHYRISVSCPANMEYVAPTLRLLQPVDCTTSV